MEVNMATRNSAMKLNALDPQSIERIHHAALRVLEETGVQVLSKEGQKIMKEGGCEVHDNDIVTIPSKVVEKALKSAPESITLYDRYGNEECILEGWNNFYGTGSDCPFIYDRKSGERRNCTYNDIADGAKVIDYLENFNFIMPIGIISDRPTHIADVYEVDACLSNTRKPVVFTAHDRETYRASIDLAALIVGGMKKLQEKPIIGLYTEPISPLRHTPEVTDKLIVSAELGIPVVFTPCPLMGATAPATKAGIVVQSSAECLSGLVVNQLVNPGSPVIFGGVINSFDMATTIDPYGSPELRLLCAAMTDMAHYYKLPMFGTAGCSDSKMIDSQTGSESGMSILISTLNGQNLIHDIGYLDSGLLTSYDHFVLANELIAQAKFIAKGINVNDDTLAVAEIDKVANRTNYIESDFTYQFFREEFYFPKLAERNNFVNWEEKGKLSQDKIISQKVDHILETYTPDPLPRGVVKEMEKVLEGIGAKKTA